MDPSPHLSSPVFPERGPTSPQAFPTRRADRNGLVDFVPTLTTTGRVWSGVVGLWKK